MRPTIPDVLEERIIEAKVERGYGTKTEFVNEAVRLRLEELGY